MFATTQECNGAVVPVVARPDALLVTADNRGLLDEAIAKVQSLLGPAFESAAKLNALAATVKLQPGTLDVAFLEHKIPTLQGTTWSTDLDYFEPALPNNSFRPADNPAKASAATTSIGGKGSVLVLDSPIDLRYAATIAGLGVDLAGPTATYDVDGNELIDEDHGHGVFVAALIKRLAPLADVTLYGVNGGQIPGSARWSPMMFTDADLIAAMGDGVRAVGQRDDDAPLVRRRQPLARRRQLRRRRRPARPRPLHARPRRRRRRPPADRTSPPPATTVSTSPTSRPPSATAKTMEAAAARIDDEVGQSPSAEGDAVRTIGTDLALRTIAVGSWTAGVRDGFSNCGDWVNAVADGAGTVSRYPSPNGWASWSGTSFATPQVERGDRRTARRPASWSSDAIGAC